MGWVNPMRDKTKRQEPGGETDDTYNHGLSRSWMVEVCEKKNYVEHERIKFAADSSDELLYRFRCFRGLPNGDADADADAVVDVLKLSSQTSR